MQSNFTVRKNQLEHNLSLIENYGAKANIKLVEGNVKETLFGSTTKEKIIYNSIKFFSKYIVKDFNNIEQAKKTIKKEFINSINSRYLSLIILGKNEFPKNSKMDFRRQIIHQIFLSAEKKADGYKIDLLNLLNQPHTIISNVAKSEFIYLGSNTEQDFFNAIYPNFEVKLEKGFKEYLKIARLEKNDLEKFIKNKATRSTIEKLCKMCYCMESFEFIIAVHKYKKLPINKKEEAGNEIIKQFLTSNIDCINITSLSKKNCLDTFKIDKANAFNETYKEILSLLSGSFCYFS